MTVESQSPAEPDLLLERVQKHPLPERSIPIINSYEDVVGDRDRLLWQWAHHLLPTFTLSCVPPEHVEEIRNTKLLGLIFVSIFDDVAEMHEARATFEEAAKIPFEHQSVNPGRDGVDREVLALASDIWDQLSPTLRDAPRAAEFGAIVRFDLKQMLNAMEYSSVANQNLDALTRSELQTYDAHDMMLFGFADVDLVHSPAFDRSELSDLRRVIERAQRMVRIGNWITTWERELSEGDFASGVVAHAVEHDTVAVEDLRASRDAAEPEVETIIGTIHEHGVEEVFLDQCHEELVAAREFEAAFESVDVGAYLDGIETIMDYHLASRGLK